VTVIASSPAGTSTARPDVVVIDDVSKRFVIRKDKSIKERIVTLGRAGRANREDFWALDGVDLHIPAGETIALIGHNGSGKSTLLKVIGGIIDPSSGSIRRRGRIAALLELGAGFHPDLTGRENVFLNASILGMSHEETEARFADILDFADIGDFIDTQVKFYSSGMYVRLAFAVAVHTDPDLLLVDEVLAVGDEAFQRKCMDKIESFQKEGRTIILVTHSLQQVVELADRAVLLDHGKVVMSGDPREAVAVFRDLLGGRAVDDAQADSKIAADARIHTVAARAVGRAADEPVQQGDDLEIAVEIEHKSGIDDWVCAAHVISPAGGAVFATSTEMLGLEPTPLRERRTVRFVLKNVNFGEGRYFVTIGLSTSTGRHLAEYTIAASFDMTEFARAVGLVALDAEVSA